MILGLTTATYAAFTFMLIFSVQLLLVLALRKPLRLWLGARQSYWLWLLPAVWLPFYFLSDKIVAMALTLAAAISSLLPSFETTSQGSASQERLALLPRELFTDLVPPLTLDSGLPTESSFPVLLILAIIWLAGLLTLASIQFIRLHQFRQYLKTHSVPAPQPEVISPGTACLALRAMDGPAVFGILKPVVLIPEDYFQRYDSNQRHLMMAHEQVHLQRRDNLWNLLAEAVRILFWFNPLVHIAYRCYRMDQELSCDALALARCNANQQQSFARTLLETRTGTAPTPPFALTAWDNFNELRERSMMIRKHLQQKKRPTVNLLAATVIVFGGAACTSLLAQNMPEEQPGNYITGGINTSVVDEESDIINLVDTSRTINRLKSQGNIPAARELLSGFHQSFENDELSNAEARFLWSTEAGLDTTEGLYTAAIDDLNKAILFERNEQKRSHLLHSLGSHHQSLGQYEQAITAFQEAYTLNPDSYPELLYQLASLYHLNGNEDSALEYARLYRFEILSEDINKSNHEDYFNVYSLYKTINAVDEAGQVGSVLNSFYLTNSNQSAVTKLL